MRLLLPHILMLFALFLSFVSEGQQYQFKNYSVGDGLAQSQVYSIIEDQKGYIWMGTRGGGISRYDGFNFTTFTTKDGLVSNYIWTLFEDSQGRIWIGTSNGISLFDNNSFYNYGAKGVDQLITSVITETKEHEILIGTNVGVLQFQDSIFAPYPVSNIKIKNAVSALYVDKQASVWMGSDNGIHVLSGKKTKHFNRRKGLNSNLIRAIAQDQNGDTWVGTYGQGVNLIRDNKVTNLNSLLQLDKTVITSLFCDSKGQTWISTIEKGICKFNPSDSTVVFLTERKGLANNHTRVITEDRWGNYWMGTSGGGVSKYKGQQFEYFSKSNGLAGNYIYALDFDLEGRMWVSTSGLGVTMVDSNRYTHYAQDSGFADVKVKAIHQGIDGLVWFGTEGQGLYYFDGDTFGNINSTSGLTGNWVKDIEEDDDGNLWVATAGGGITKISILHSFLQNKSYLSDSIPYDSIQLNQWDTVDYIFTFDRFNTKTGLSSNRINQLHFDGYGRCWYATQANGLGYIDHDTLIVNINSTNGLNGNSIRSIAEDTYGNLWAGTGGKGLNKLYIYEDSTRIESINSEHGLQSDNIYQLSVDNNDNLWVGSEKGVDQVKLNKEGDVLEIEHYGKNDGFIGVETSLNAIAMDTLGNTWFGTINGLSKYIVGNTVTNKQPPVLSFTNVELNYEPIEKSKYLNKNMILKHNMNQITFDFIGIMQTNPEKVKYQWKLTGLEEDWSPPSNKKSITYSNLFPAEYTFEVRAANENNVWSEPIEIKFTIKPPIWQEWWFLTVSGIGGLSIIIGIILLRINIIKRRAERERQQLLMEKELLQLEQKALRLQMNPHFIFNALNTIQALVSSNDSKTARYYLAKFSKLMRQILDNSRQTSIPLEHEIITLENYLAIEQFCHGNRFEYELNIDDDIDTEFVQIPPMLLQPFIENAIIHGVSQKQDKGKIEVAFVLDNESILCTVTDNGIGRERASEMKSQRDQHHKSTALIVTQERLDIINDTGEQQESISIIDLIDDHQQAAGTKVSVRIKL